VRIYLLLASLIENQKMIQKKKTKEGFFLREEKTAWIFILPLILYFFSLMIYPFINGIFISLTRKLVGFPPIFVGLGNYIDLLHDWVFHRVVRNSFIYTFGAVSIKLGLGMIMALSLSRGVRGLRFFRGFFLLPWITPTVVAGLIWVWIFQGEVGFLNITLMSLKIIKEQIPWLAVPNLALFAVIVANVWRGFPFFGVSLLAGMQSIPDEYYEAAKIDGASAAQRFFHITLPLIRPVIMVCSLISIVRTFNDFNLVWIMTRGGPARSTHIFATYTYETGFLSFQWGRAMAISIYITPLLIVAIILLSRYLLKER